MSQDASVVVFGGAGALGSAVTLKLARSFDSVVAFDSMIPDKGRQVEGVSYQLVNALDENSVSNGFAGLAYPLWAVVNVIGGYTPGQSLVDLDISVLKHQLDLNLVSATIITKHALRKLHEQGSPGRIVHTSSRVAVQDGANGFAYSVSKLGVVRLVEAAAAETKGTGITLNCVMPSIIDTPANRAAMPGADYDRWPKPEEIAEVVDFLVSERSGLVSGAAIPVYGRA